MRNATQLNNNDMKALSFAEAYGLGLIARNPENDWSGIVEHLSNDAQKIAFALITPGSGSRTDKSAAQQLLDLAKRVRTTGEIH